MKKESIKNSRQQDEAGELTRRGFLDRIMLTAAGGAALMIAGTQQAEAKVSKASAKYRSSPKMGRSCKGCTRYQGNGKCATVKGTVSSNGYCNYYARKSSYSY